MKVEKSNGSLSFHVIPPFHPLFNLNRSLSPPGKRDSLVLNPWMDPRAPPPLGMVAPPHLRPPDPPHRLLLRPTSFLEQQPSIKGEYIEDLEGIKFEPAEPPRSPEHVSRQQFLKQFPLISVRPPSPVAAPLPLPTLIPVSQHQLRFPPGLFPGHQVQIYQFGIQKKPERSMLVTEEPLKLTFLLYKSSTFIFPLRLCQTRQVSVLFLSFIHLSFLDV